MKMKQSKTALQSNAFMAALLKGNFDEADDIYSHLPVTDTAIDYILSNAGSQKAFPNIAEYLNRKKILPDTAKKSLQLSRRHLSQLERIACEIPGHPIILKGPSMARYYPKAVHRWSTDLDICVPDFQQLDKVSTFLRSLGFDYSGRLAWMIDSHSSMVTTLIRFVNNDHHLEYSKLAARPRYGTSLEVHLGGIRTSLSTRVSWEELEDYVEISDQLCGAHVLEPTMQFCIMLMDYDRSITSITLRNLADMHHFTNAVASRVAFDDVNDFIKKHALERGLLKLMEAYKQHSYFPIPDVISALIEESKPKIIYKKRAASITLRLTRFANFRIEKRSKRLAFVLSALAREYTWNISLRVHKSWVIDCIIRASDGTWFVPYMVNKGISVVMIPVTKKPVHETTWVHVKKYLFYSCPAGTFFATHHGILDVHANAILSDYLKRISS